MSILASIMAYALICVVYGTYRALNYRREAGSGYSPDLFWKIARYPGTGLGLLRRDRDQREHKADLLPAEWYTSDSLHRFNLVALLIVAVVLFGWQDITRTFVHDEGGVGEFAANAIDGALTGLAQMFLALLKFGLLGIAFLLLVVVPKNRAMRIERDFWKSKSQ